MRPAKIKLYLSFAYHFSGQSIVKVEITVWIFSLKRHAVCLGAKLILTNLALNNTVYILVAYHIVSAIVSVIQKLIPLIFGAKIKAIFKLIFYIRSANAVSHIRIVHALAHVKLSYSVNDRFKGDFVNNIETTVYMDCRGPRQLACRSN